MAGSVDAIDDQPAGGGFVHGAQPGGGPLARALPVSRRGLGCRGLGYCLIGGFPGGVRG
jgi:hypothetical protein